MCGCKILYDMALAEAPVKSHYQVTLFPFSVYASYMWLPHMFLK